MKRKSVTSLTISFPKVVTRAICIFVAHASTGQTPTGARLRQVLDTYVPRIEDPALQHKPISILVITDGVPSKFLDRVGEIERQPTSIPADDPRSVIVEFARRLDVKNVPLRQLGIQFVQIGDDPDATAALKELDDNLGPTHGVRVSN